jgi:hypothetical protein
MLLIKKSLFGIKRGAKVELYFEIPKTYPHYFVEYFQNAAEALAGISEKSGKSSEFPDISDAWQKKSRSPLRQTEATSVRILSRRINHPLINSIHSLPAPGIKSI